MSHGSCDGAERERRPESTRRRRGRETDARSRTPARASSSRTWFVTRDENNLNVHWISILRARTHSRFVSLCPESNLQRTLSESTGAPTCSPHHVSRHTSHMLTAYTYGVRTPLLKRSLPLSLSLSYGHAVHAHLHDPLCARSVRASARIRSAHTALLQASTRFRRMPRWPQ